MMRRVKTLLLLSVLCCLPSLGAAAEKVVAKTRPDVSLRNEVENSLGKGLTWLAGQQAGEGNWSQPEHPAATGLVLTAFQGDPSTFYKHKFEAQIGKGYDYLLRSVKPDGGIYVKDLANYNTSISMMALLMANRPEFEPILKKARGFEINLQDKPESGDAMEGGIGYGGSYRHSDLNNTTFAMEALYYTRYLKSDLANDPDGKDLNWKAALKFVTRCQNLPDSNDQKWASADADNKGGFIYFPGDSKAGEQQLPGGKVALRSYGSMSYAGLLSLVYAQLDKGDPRVKAVIDWLSRNYTLAENPGMGPEGLYYYYHTMAKALSAAGVDTITLKDGRKVSWRRDLAKKLLDLQQANGSWVNTSGRWWEKDPTLVTSYAVITLEIIHRGL
jgi:squalene-hopene/tetraprenyl-beta-curcumene cyclase